MSAQTRKSRKRSAANSRPQPDDVPLYLDRNLGKHVIATALRNAGAIVEIHDDHLSPDAADEDWIALVGRKRWLAITKDKNIRYRTAELAAIKEHHAMALVVRAKNATGQEIAETLVKSLNRIQRFVREHDRPFVAGIIRSGRIFLYEF